MILKALTLLRSLKAWKLENKSCRPLMYQQTTKLQKNSALVILIARVPAPKLPPLQLHLNLIFPLLQRSHCLQIQVAIPMLFVRWLRTLTPQVHRAKLPTIRSEERFSRNAETD